MQAQINKTEIPIFYFVFAFFAGELIVVTLGSLTNVALAITLDTGFMGRLKHLYLAAGFVKS